MRSPKSDKSFPIFNCQLAIALAPEMSILAWKNYNRKSAIGNRQLKVFWRRGWDSNPRNGFPLTAFPVLPIQPLLHLSPRNFGLRIADFGFEEPPRSTHIQTSNPFTQKSAIRNPKSEILMAERVGFEPTVELPPLQFSRLACSAAPAPLRTSLPILRYAPSGNQRSNCVELGLRVVKTCWTTNHSFPGG